MKTESFENENSEIIKKCPSNNLLERLISKKYVQFEMHVSCVHRRKNNMMGSIRNLFLFRLYHFYVLLNDILVFGNISLFSLFFITELKV